MDNIVPEGDLPEQGAEIGVNAPAADAAPAAEEAAAADAAPAAEEAAAADQVAHEHRSLNSGRVRRRRRSRRSRRRRRGRGQGGPMRAARSESPPIDPFIPPMEGIPNPLADHAAMVRAEMELEAVRESSNPHGDGPSPVPSEDED